MQSLLELLDELLHSLFITLNIYPTIHVNTRQNQWQSRYYQYYIITKQMPVI